MGLWIRAKLDFSKHHFLRFFEKLDPDIFPKSQIFKISCSSHSENAHIKINGFQSIFGGWGDMPFIYFDGPEWPKVRKWTPPELFIHLGGAIGQYVHASSNWCLPPEKQSGYLPPAILDPGLSHSHQAVAREFLA